MAISTLMACSTRSPPKFAPTKHNRAADPPPTAFMTALPPSLSKGAHRLAQRVAAIEPFHVMEMAKEAVALERAGRDIIHMSIGEPDFTAPDAVIAAATDALRRGVTQYTPALGLTALRVAIAEHYAHSYGLQIDPARVIVTAGASAALLLAC